MFDNQGFIYRGSLAPGRIYTRTTNGNCYLESGKFYKDQRINLSKADIDNPGVAMIAYVGGNGSVETGNSSYRGLAIALRDCNPYNSSTGKDYFYGPDWCTQTSATCTSGYNSQYNTDVTVARGWKNGISMTSDLILDTDGHNHWAAKAASTYNVTHPSNTSGWFLASLGQWQLILQGLVTKVDNLSQLYSASISGQANPKMTYDHLDSVLENAGTYLSDCYWSSSEYDASESWFVAPSNGTASHFTKKSNQHDVRAVLAFE